MSREFVISVQRLSKCYQIYERPEDRLKQSLWRGRKDFYREFWALHDVSFEVRKGEAIGIIGRNGSGKSTLLQLIAGTLSPTAGSVEVSGRAAALLELGSGFNPDFSGRENVYLNGAILGLTREEIDRRYEEIINFADIGNFIDQPVKTYSSGMMVRLAFAVSVCIEPDILIVDEALAVGDIGFQLKCMERLDQLTRSGTTLLFVSHDIATVKTFCQRAIYLANGRVKAVGSASDVAELYMLDVKDGQKRALTPGHGITAKTALGGDKAFAFGTAQGQIARAYFSDTGGRQSTYATGDRVEVIVDVEFDASVRHPSVSLIICDHRMIELAGRYIKLAKRPDHTGITKSTLAFAFSAELNAGHYFVMLRLEERIADNNQIPVDKQVGALSFSVVRPAQAHFIGMVRLPIEATDNFSQ